MDDIKKELRKILRSKINFPIYPSHISLIKQPEFPCISLSRNSGITNENHFSEEVIVNVDIWSKKNNDELWEIYNQVKALLNLKTGYFLCKLIYVNDDLYENDSRTHHLASRYRIIKKEVI